MRQLMVKILSVMACLSFGANIVVAVPLEPTTDAATSSPAVQTFTLFNPTPVDRMRDMDTDRPDKTNSPHTIDPGHLQIETGLVDYVFDRDHYQGDNARSDSFAIGQEDIRLGVLGNLELDAYVPLYNFTRTTDFNTGKSIRQNGVGDVTVGGSLNLWGNDSGDKIWASGLAIQPNFKIPTARREIGNGHFEASLGFPFLLNLPADFHLGLQTTLSDERNSSDTGNVLGWQNSAVVDHVIFSKFDVYLEYWSHVSTEHHRQAQQTIDIGATYPLTDSIVLDTGFNLGLNRVTDDFEWTTGFSVRF